MGVFLFFLVFLTVGWLFLEVCALKKGLKTVAEWVLKSPLKEDTDKSFKNIQKQLEEQLNITCFGVDIRLKHPEIIGVKSFLEEKYYCEPFSILYLAGQVLIVHDGRIAPQLGFREALQNNYFLNVVKNENSLLIELEKKVNNKSGESAWADYEVLESADFPIKKFIESPDGKKKSCMEIESHFVFEDFGEDRDKFPNDYKFSDGNFVVWISVRRPARKLNTQYLDD